MIALLLALILPQPDTVYRERVDMIEVNHLYDDKGRHMVDQIIFWRNYHDGRLHVIDEYRKVRVTGLPERDHRAGGYVLRWTEQQAIREIRAISIWESWAMQPDDPELLDREIVPKDDRPKLRALPPVKPFVHETPPQPPPDDGA